MACEDELQLLNDSLKAEADEILHRWGLLGLLRRFGRPVVHGSYALDLMTWRDLDIYLVGAIRVRDFFLLGGMVAESLHAPRMSYRNTLCGGEEGLPPGLYWGAHFGHGGGEWKVDLWAIDEQELRVFEEQHRSLRERMGPRERRAILSIKRVYCRDARYRKSVYSVDIYRAVLEDGCETVEDFEEFLASR